MRHVERTVFISYRRTNAPWALAVFKELTHHGYDVFFDYTGIPSGDFERVVLENIRARAHFLVLLSPSTLDRCSDPVDEAAAALEPSFKLKFPRHKPKKQPPHETCDRLMSQFTSQWDDLKKEIRDNAKGFGSSGWTRTSNPPANSVTWVVGLGGSSSR